MPIASIVTSESYVYMIYITSLVLYIANLHILDYGNSVINLNNIRGSPNIEMDEHTFLVNRERAVDYLNSLDKVHIQITTFHMFISLSYSF